jgi:hypothetical protein
MDFRLYGRVLWRFRLIVAGGFVVALILAMLAIVRIGPHGLSYRHHELWATTTRLLVTQKGFPEGRLYAQDPTTAATLTPGQEAARLRIPVADPARFNNLAILYAELATSDPVRTLMLRDGPIVGQTNATPLRDEASGVLLPLIDLTAISTSPTAAIKLADRNAAALDEYVSGEQHANNVPRSDRVVVQTVVEPRRAKVFQPRSKTMAIVVFLAVLLATVGLAFALENLRPRVRTVNEAGETKFESLSRRTA